MSRLLLGLGAPGRKRRAGGGGGGGDPFWGVESQTVSTTASVGGRLGWRFTVGASDLTVNALRVYRTGTGWNESLIIHRVSDGVAVASGIVPSGGSADVWTTVAVDEVVLAAGVSYTISAGLPGARSVYRNPSGLTIFAGVTKTANVFGTGDTLPASTSSNVYTFVDFGFE